MDRATTSSNWSASVEGMTEFATVNESSTNPNSPAWARPSVNSQRSEPPTLETRRLRAVQHQRP